MIAKKMDLDDDDHHFTETIATGEKGSRDLERFMTDMTDFNDDLNLNTTKKKSRLSQFMPNVSNFGQWSQKKVLIWVAIVLITDQINDKMIKVF